MNLLIQCVGGVLFIDPHRNKFPGSSLLVEELLHMDPTKISAGSSSDLLLSIVFTPSPSLQQRDKAYFCVELFDLRLQFHLSSEPCIVGHPHTVPRLCIPATPTYLQSCVESRILFVSPKRYHQGLISMQFTSSCHNRASCA